MDLPMVSPRTIRAAVAIPLFILLIAPLMAQAPAATALSATMAVGSASQPDRLDLLVGRSAVIRLDQRITRVSLPAPDIADALVTSPNEVLVHGKAPGTISMLVWGDSGSIRSYEVAVARDLKPLEERVRQLFPGEPI